MSPVHEQLVHEELAALEDDPDVIGVLLQGSLARGDSYLASDLDLFLLLQDGVQRPFTPEQRGGILIERHAYDSERATVKVRANPMLAYGFTDGQILRDDTGALAVLQQVAQEVIDSYTTPPAERAGISYWLQSARIKIKAAHDAGDNLKALFVVATTSWKILEGMWALNYLPMPPAGAVLAHRFDLKNAPVSWNTLFTQLFRGSEIERIAAAITLIEWMIVL